MSVNRIARWDGSVWSALGTGMNNHVRALAVLPGGDLAAGGEFTIAGGLDAFHIARWNGSSWSPLGTGMNGDVWALLLLPGGDVVAGGNFTTAGGVPAARIARWDGSIWSPFGAGIDGDVRALAVMPNGNVVAVGDFFKAGGVKARTVARWDGSTWSPLGAGLLSGGLDPLPAAVHALILLPSGDLVAGGSFSVGGCDDVARWDGSAWSAVGSGTAYDVNTASSVFALALTASGDLFAGGKFFVAGGVGAQNIARWNNSAWSHLGTGFGGGHNQPSSTSINALALMPGGDLLAAGMFNIAGGTGVHHVARWDGLAWLSLGAGVGVTDEWGPPAQARALALLPSGDIVVGGVFKKAGGVDALRIARWNGTAWSGLGAGVSGGFFPGSPGKDFANVSALAVLPSGNLVVGGLFSQAGSVSAHSVAQWNGSAWSALGTGILHASSIGVAALAVLPSGDVVAGGDFYSAGG